MMAPDNRKSVRPRKTGSRRKASAPPPAPQEARVEVSPTARPRGEEYPAPAADAVSHAAARPHGSADPSPDGVVDRGEPAGTIEGYGGKRGVGGYEQGFAGGQQAARGPTGPKGVGDRQNVPTTPVDESTEIAGNTAAPGGEADPANDTGIIQGDSVGGDAPIVPPARRPRRHPGR